MVPTTTRILCAFGWTDPIVRLVTRFLNLKTKKCVCALPVRWLGTKLDLIQFHANLVVLVITHPASKTVQFVFHVLALDGILDFMKADAFLH